MSDLLGSMSPLLRASQMHLLRGPSMKDTVEELVPVSHWAQDLRVSYMTWGGCHGLRIRGNRARNSTMTLCLLRLSVANALVVVFVLDVLKYASNPAFLYQVDPDLSRVSSRQRLFLSVGVR